MSHRSVDEYLKLPYTFEIIRDSDENNPGWVARVVELPGCFTQGDSIEELETMIEDAMRGWLEIAIEDGLPIPEPRIFQEYSGKFIVRVPKSLHRALVEQAEQENISLNQHISTVLAMAVGIAKVNAIAPPQVTRDEIREWISEGIQNILNEDKAAKEVKQTEKATQYNSGDELIHAFFGSIKVEVDELKEIDFQAWSKEPGQEPIERIIKSGILDNLLE